MPDIGPMELIIILAIALIVIGPKKLPDAGKSIGKGIREFKDGISGASEKETAKIPERTAPTPEPAVDLAKPAEEKQKATA